MTWIYHQTLHHFWLWFWFLFGCFIYMLKRAYYLVTGPNPVANTYAQFVERCWIPLLVRLVVDSGIYWMSFYPDIFNFVVAKAGWQLHSPIPQYGVVALFMGLGMDSLVDFVVSKVPIIRDWLPQMPPPLKPGNATP